MYPFFHTLTKCPNKNTYTRIYEFSFQRLFEFLEPQSSSQSRPSKRRRKVEKKVESAFDLDKITLTSPSSSSSESPKSVDEVLKALRQAFFDYGAKEDTVDANRKRMYAVWRAGEEVES